jgi:hypothetical protein
MMRDAARRDTYVSIGVTANLNLIVLIDDLHGKGQDFAALSG